jgi:hypothetical protein
MFERDGDKLGDVDWILWRAGWNRLGAFVITTIVFFPLLVLAGFDPGAGFSIGVFLGIVLWITGLSYVNQNYEQVLNEYKQYVQERTKNLTSKAGEGVSSYTLTYASDSPIFMTPARTYYSTNLLVDDASVEILEGIGLDMAKRTPYLNDESREVYYDQVSSVSYNRPVLEINTSDGETLKYRSSREPGDALNDLQTRIRSFKTEATA